MRVLVIALNGMTFDLSTLRDRLIATVLAGIAEFERELIQVYRDSVYGDILLVAVVKLRDRHST